MPIGLTQVLKELMRRRRLIIDKLSQQRDASPQRKAQAEAQAREELAKTDEQIAKVKSELDAATPESLEWGPDASRQRLEETMERYNHTPEQIELPLTQPTQPASPISMRQESARHRELMREEYANDPYFDDMYWE